MKKTLMINMVLSVVYILIYAFSTGYMFWNYGKEIPIMGYVRVIICLVIAILLLCQNANESRTDYKYEVKNSVVRKMWIVLYVLYIAEFIMSGFFYLCESVDKSDNTGAFLMLTATFVLQNVLYNTLKRENKERIEC